MPSGLEAGPVIEAAALFEGVLGWARDREAGETAPGSLVELLIRSPMNETSRGRWLERVRRDKVTGSAYSHA